MPDTPMRRKEKEITDKAEIEAILHKAHVCRLGMAEGRRPYIVPLCFGYRDNTLYFHAAREGKKLDILKKNDVVCFECDIDHQLMRSEKPCEWGMEFRSVIGFGKASLIEDRSSKQSALDVIMEHYSGVSTFAYPDKILEKIVMIKVDIASMTGKKSDTL